MTVAWGAGEDVQESLWDYAKFTDRLYVMRELYMRCVRVSV